MSDGNGNGASKAEARMERGCPVEPSVRPGECNAIHAELGEIRRTQAEHGRALRKMGREQSAMLLVLQTAAEQLARIEAAHGMKHRTGGRR